jgi:ribonuclease Z
VQAVQNSSHTPQKALGYILSQTNPRLGVATHFQVNDDTVGPALDDIRSWYQGPVAIATDLLVINVSSSQIRQRRAVVDDYAWYAKPTLSSGLAPALYPTPTAQLDQTVLLDHCIQEAVYDNPPQ